MTNAEIIRAALVAYAAATLQDDAPFPCDALTVSPYLGLDTLAPFVTAARRHDRGLFVVYRTSNPGSATFQAPAAEPLSDWLTRTGAADTDERGLSGLGAVVGVTHPGALSAARSALPRAWLLLPGYGAQGGTAADCQPGFRADGLGALIVAARSATFPEADDAQAPAWALDPEPFIAERIRTLRAEIEAVVRCVPPA